MTRLSVEEKNKIVNKLKKEHNNGRYYDCMECSHAMVNDDDKLVCTVTAKHKIVENHHTCLKWN